MGASSAWASMRLPCCCHRRARLMAARSSRDLACWWRASWLPPWVLLADQSASSGVPHMRFYVSQQREKGKGQVRDWNFPPRRGTRPGLAWNTHSRYHVSSRRQSVGYYGCALSWGTPEVWCIAPSRHARKDSGLAISAEPVGFLELQTMTWIETFVTRL